MNSRKLLLLFLTGAAIVYSCNKNKLDQQALVSLDESSIENKEGVEALLIGAYSMLDGISAPAILADGGAGSNWIFGSVCGSEAYKGSRKDDMAEITSLEKFIPNASNPQLAGKWLAVYTGVQRTNAVLRILKKAKGISRADSLRIAAEARFLRGHYHFEAIKIWNKVPYVDETITYEAGNFRLGNKELIWPEIEGDLKFAMESLQGKMEAKGRANKYAAEAFLAKAYLFQHKYDSAMPLLQDLISNGTTAGGEKYALTNKYQDNFNPDQKNSTESVFAVQSSVNDGSGGYNGNLGDIFNYPVNPDGPGGGCCGFFNLRKYLVNHFKTDSNGLPDLYNFDVSDVKNDEGYASADSFTPYNGTLDPRLDWTVGRRGIPYLDWGIHPGYDWIGDQGFAGPYSPIKNIYYKSQQGHLSDASFWTAGSTATNINLIRFADVLLWYAEVHAQVGSIDSARYYVNLVRERAMNPDGWVHTYLDPADPAHGFTSTPAANYHIGKYEDPWPNDRAFALKAIYFERMLELSLEGHRFFDLVRWGIADTEIKAYFLHEKNTRTYLNDANFTKGVNEYFPLPEAQIDLSAGPDGVRLLIQNPGY